MGSVTPFASGERWQIYQGDCALILPTFPDGSADCVVMDPPYCSGGSLEAQRTSSPPQGVRSEVSRREGYEWFDADQMSTAGIVWLLRWVLVQCRRILATDSSLFVFTDWRMVPSLVPALESTGLRWRNQIVWNKDSTALGWGFRPQHEMILEFIKGVNPYYSPSGSNVVTLPRVSRGRKLHPAQKPVPLIGDILRVACRPGGTVLDPFMGSAAVGQAAVHQGREFVGIDLAPAPCRKAAERLAALGAD